MHTLTHTYTHTYRSDHSHARDDLQTPPQRYLLGGKSGGGVHVWTAPCRVTVPAGEYCSVCMCRFMHVCVYMCVCYIRVFKRYLLGGKSGIWTAPCRVTVPEGEYCSICMYMCVFVLYVCICVCYIRV